MEGFIIINTVNGPITKEELGLCLSHEHIAWDSRYATNNYFYKMYDDQETDHIYQKLIPVFRKLYKLGCRAIAEASPPRGGLNLKLMQKLSISSGIHIIPSTGIPFTRMVYQVHPTVNIDELVNIWTRDHQKGFDELNNINIKPGQIKVLLGDEGGPGVLPEVDQRILRASIRASKKTGLPVHCHLLEARTAEVAFQILEEEDANYDQFLWAHIGHDQYPDFSIIEKAIEKGMWLGLDEIRPENYEKYFKILNFIVERQYTHKILLSQDYDFLEEINKLEDENKCTSIITDFIPYCENHGIPSSLITDILTHNPANYFNV